ncbi:hypothetical protein [Leyella stercorea]|uniref:hypothetical protein n=1 Tax=Leyella stercorea TaxID=363265 RepID=UPI00242FBD82|nr:hypothetical protein [Leyella stercorea]
MKYRIMLVWAFLLTSGCLYAQNNDGSYRRSSLYSLMINHEDQQFSRQIKEAFVKIPIPEKFNNHELSVKILSMGEKLKGASSNKENEDVTTFLQRNLVASRLVGKWFNRDVETGACDMELIKERGLYNASEYDRIMAEKSSRSTALLMDAGEDLIGNTFVLVNDIRYVDKSGVGTAIGVGLKVLGAVAGAVTGNADMVDLGNSYGDLAATYKGFKVKINTFLYRLVWDESTAAIFYKDQYSAKPDKSKRQNFENARGSYMLRYVGKVESSGKATSFMGIKEDKPELMVRKACQRALDENIASLQHGFEEFRVKSPLASVEPITAFVGMKEGITEDSQFEVLEVIEKDMGVREYKRVGIIKPAKNMIWDNRYLADEEGTIEASLGHTTFKKVSGGDFYPGMLIREIEK